MNLKQIEYFIALAEELHFGRAAERLGMAQPPLSRQIQQIEADLGAQLINRGRNAISLTQAGERFYERGSALLAELGDIRLEIRRIGQGAEGRLRIGFVGSATYGMLPTILKSFRASWPEVNLSLVPMNNAQLQRSLIRRDIDIAIARPALNDSEIVTRKLIDEPLVLAAPDALITTPGPVSLPDLGQPSYILYPEYPRPSFADVVIAACESVGADTSRRVFTMDFQTAIALVSVGEGVALVPASVGTAQRNGVRYHEIAGLTIRTGISVNHRIDEQGIHVHNFVTLAQKVSRKVV
ncbi:LysR family transcriptional regulator [Aquamicrobium defluvii]|uniref:LysR family transcriptional regulator n=1 Tax=Aquamicrobium defluvii TaxID=69279 RepID=A0A011VLP3_9HYPH|nr:LysR family transcriptional regulator [Aquamicrobium defluvii]EXL09335.1 LysR family transcriptional regulator [Aquamicrobium defluvii]EZQ15500.1 LysR family transcriptional regulator [Halopseudomonas bauzanensis]TDR36172.1 LysR family transcriptional regulator [Aquamicrobium defluvii]